MSKKVPIIPKLGLHKMYTKFKLVCLFMQPAEKPGRSKFTEMGIFAVEFLKTLTFSKGYVFEMNYS